MSAAPPKGDAAAPPVGDDSWALRYTGGKAGRASGEPFVIGWVNQEGAMPGFPGATIGANAALEYLNEKLGGVGGRPLKLDPCLVKSEEDGQRCGIQMLNNDDVSVILTGVLVSGNKSFYNVIDNKKPIIIGNPIMPDDYFSGVQSPNAFAFTPGTPGVTRGTALFALKHLNPPPKTVVIVANDSPTSNAYIDQLLRPVLEKGGVKITTAYVPDAAQAPDYAQALQAAGTDKADVLIPMIHTTGCLAIYDALAGLKHTPAVLASQVCAGSMMMKHMKNVGATGDFPDGWYFVGYGYNYHMPDEDSGVSTYLRVMKAKGPNVELVDFAGATFANVMTLVRFINQIGPDKMSSEALAQAVRGFKGPKMMMAGPVQCGLYPAWPTLCSSHVGVQRYKDGQWISIADGRNGKAIDARDEVALGPEGAER